MYSSELFSVVKIEWTKYISKLLIFNLFRFIYQKVMHCKIDSNITCSFKNQIHTFLCYKNFKNLKLFLLTMLNVWLHNLHKNSESFTVIELKCDFLKLFLIKVL